MKRYEYNNFQLEVLKEITKENSTINELLKYIINQGIHPNNAYLILLGATLKNIENVQYKNEITPNMINKIKYVSNLEHLAMIHEKIVNKIVDYSSFDSILYAKITLALAETFYSFEPIEKLPDNATHNLVFGYGQMLIGNLTNK